MRWPFALPTGTAWRVSGQLQNDESAQIVRKEHVARSRIS